jgi:signal transduction histidine kinase
MSARALAENRLLQLFDGDALGPLTPVHLAARQVVQEPGAPVLHAYFPLTAVISLVSTMESGASAEVALVGREGMVGLAGMLGTVEGATTAVVQVPGDAVRVPLPTLRAARAHNAAVRATLDAYTQARYIQVAQSAACSRLHRVEARLARWLLETRERIDHDDFVVSQEFIAGMLGVQRPTVSGALQDLQNHGALLRRGRAIVVTNRSVLERHACECHGVITREFNRLLRPRATLPDALLTTSPSPTPGEGDATTALEALRDIAGRLLMVSLREQEARERAESAWRASDHLLTTISHELRTPLTAILGWCATLAAHPDQSALHGLDVIARNAAAQLKLVDDLLDAARTASATLSIHSTAVDLPAIASMVVDTLKPAADEKRVALRVAAADEVPPVLGDPDRLRQVLLNVVSNSLKFTEAGGSIDVRIDEHNGLERVIVRDSGKGIPASVLPHVFERFTQGSPGGGRDTGLGLGLTIARALVELHGGTIALESPGENRGTTCTIALPLAPAPRSSAGLIPA